MTQSNLSFYCPANNVHRRPPILESGEYSLKCQVCAILDPQIVDTDPRQGYLSLHLEFGPNALLGTVDEEGILGYAVFFADNCSNKLGEAVAYLDTEDWGETPASCCQQNAYTVDIQSFLPRNDTEVVLMIVPNTTVGMLTAGLTTEPLVDYINATASFRPGQVSAAGRPRPQGAGSWALAAVGLAAAALAAGAGGRGEAPGHG